MSQSTFCRPKLLINNKEVAFCNSADISCKEGSLESFSASITEPDLENINLFNEKVEFYLNYGGEDGAPIFRGYIKSFRAGDDNISITALDPRTFLSGSNAFPIIIDDKYNYDGQTVVQFLTDVVNNVNINETLISIEALNEMDKPVYMTDVRSVSPPYDIASGLVQKQRDDDNILSVFEYYFDIIHGAINSSLVIRKTKDLTTNPDFVYSYTNGIVLLNYTERAPPSFALAKAEDGTTVRADYGNAPRGQVGINVANNTYSSRAEAKEAALVDILLKQDDDKDITMQVSKGYHLNLGQIIRLEVEDSNLLGQYRITGKRVSYSNSGVSCSFNLNKKPIKLADFI